MRLGIRSRLIIELSVAAGLDALRSLSAPRCGLGWGGSYEDERAFLKHLRRMEKNGLLELDESSENGQWVARLTEAGVNHVTDEIDPVRRWDSEWDGIWRLITFDLPSAARKRRLELNQWLQMRRFGGLQGSVRVSPIFEESWKAEIEGLKIPPSCMALFEGKPFALNVDRDIVREGWDFKGINEAYENLISFLRSRPIPELDEASVRVWLEEENSLWRAAFELDPFLPKVLLPDNYRGREAFELRASVFRKLAGS